MTIRSNRAELSALGILANHGYLRPCKGLRIAPLLATFLLAISVLSLAAQPAAAALISDGTLDLPADGTLSLVGGSLLSTNTASASTSTFDASLYSAVYQGASSNPFVNGTYSSDPNALTFIYQVSNVDGVGSDGKTGDIDLFDVQSFGTALADVGYKWTSPQYSPVYDQRVGPPATDVIGFGFAPYLSGYSALQSGYTSALLIINTNADTYTAVGASLQDGTNTTVASYAVFAPNSFITPEPGSILLMVMGLVGLLAVVRNGRRHQAA